MTDDRAESSREFDDDYYAVLGVEEDATPEQVRQAYRDLVKQYHPDAGHGGGTTFFFRRVQEAYDTLRDPVLRERYDERLRREGKRPPNFMTIEVTVGPSVLPQLDEPQLVHSLVRISAAGVQPTARTPLNLALVLDRSTSMKGERFRAARDATISLVSSLEDDDLFSLIAFSDRAEVLLPAQHKPAVRTVWSMLGNISIGGGTEIYHGLMAGLNEVGRARSERQINHVILLTDGRTYGDAEKCLAAARAAAKLGIGISVIGVGGDWDEEFADNLSRAGGGIVRFIENVTDIGMAFQHHLLGLKDAWISDLRLRLLYDPSAEFKELFSLTPELARLAQGMESSFLIGVLQRDEARQLLLESVVRSQPSGKCRILRLEITGHMPAHGLMVRQLKSVRVEFAPKGHTRVMVPPEVLAAARQVSHLRMQERAEREAHEGHIGPALQRLSQLVAQLRREGKDDVAQIFHEEMQQLRMTGTFSPLGTKRLRYGTRTLPVSSVRRELP